MTSRRAYFPCLLAILVWSCGGVFSHNDPGQASGATGAGATGGGVSQGGGAAAAGKPSMAGSSSLGGSVSLGGSQSGCQDVMCVPVTGCGMGYALSTPPGACCEGCVPYPPGPVCTDIACPHSLCPLGYLRGDQLGGCCDVCVPDPLFCNDNSDCVLADNPSDCCHCPGAINLREYAADPCWLATDQPRMVPDGCMLSGCVEDCAPCLPQAHLRCENHRCATTPIIPK